MSPKKLRKLYERSCNGKRRHEHALSAMLHIVHLERSSPGHKLRAYVCDFCRGVHVGHDKYPHRIPQEHHIVDGMPEERDIVYLNWLQDQGTSTF